MSELSVSQSPAPSPLHLLCLCAGLPPVRDTTSPSASPNQLLSHRKQGLVRARLSREAGLWQRRPKKVAVGSSRARVHPLAESWHQQPQPLACHFCPLAFPSNLRFPAATWTSPMWPGCDWCSCHLCPPQAPPRSVGSPAGWTGRFSALLEVTLHARGTADPCPHPAELPASFCKEQLQPARGPLSSVSALPDTEPVPRQVVTTRPPGSWILERGTGSYSPL